jgi:hypothetical protein
VGVEGEATISVQMSGSTSPLLFRVSGATGTPKVNEKFVEAAGPGFSVSSPGKLAEETKLLVYKVAAAQVPCLFEFACRFGDDRYRMWIRSRGRIEQMLVAIPSAGVLESLAGTEVENTGTHMLVKFANIPPGELVQSNVMVKTTKDFRPPEEVQVRANIGGIDSQGLTVDITPPSPWDIGTVKRFAYFPQTVWAVVAG